MRTGFLPQDLPAPDRWMTSEERILRANYPSLGAKGCATLLPKRTPGAIRRRAELLRIRRQRGRVA